MQRTHAKGFTLVELLVVIAIIGILSTMITVSLNRARDKARMAVSSSEIEQIGLAIRLLYEDTGKWPAHEEMDGGLCLPAPSGGWSYEPFEEFNCEMSLLPYPGRAHLDFMLPWFGLTGLDPLNEDEYPNWQGPYLPSNFPRTDPWGKTYIVDGDYIPYGSGLTTVSVMSGGPDRTASTRADDLYDVLCYYDAIACGTQSFCPCTERP